MALIQSTKAPNRVNPAWSLRGCMHGGSRVGIEKHLFASRGTSLIRNHLPLGPYGRRMPRVLEGSRSLGPSGFERAQHRRTPRPSVDGTRSKALCPFGSQQRLVSTNISLPSTHHQYRGTSLTRKRTPLGPYRRPMHRVLGESWGGPRGVGVFLWARYPCTGDGC